eukprot:3001932-Pyramimonas_sp.AAC.1
MLSVIISTGATAAIQRTRECAMFLRLAAGGARWSPSRLLVVPTADGVDIAPVNATALSLRRKCH